MMTREADLTRRSAQWQREHDAALEALRDAEDSYQRIIAGSALLSGEDPSAVEVQREALTRLEDARRRLDEVRAEVASSE